MPTTIPTPLFQRWQELKAEKPHLHRKDHAKMLGVCEYELSAIDPSGIALQIPFMDFLLQIRQWGAFTLVLETWFADLNLKIAASSLIGNQSGAKIHSPSPTNSSEQITVNLSFGSWAYFLAFSEKTPTHIHYWFQVFDAQGNSLIKFIPHEIDTDQWQSFINKNRQPADQAQAPVLPRHQYLPPRRSESKKKIIDALACQQFFHEVTRPGQQVNLSLQLAGQGVDLCNTIIASKSIWTQSTLCGSAFCFTLHLDHLGTWNYYDRKPTDHLHIVSKLQADFIRVDTLHSGRV